MGGIHWLIDPGRGNPCFLRGKFLNPEAAKNLYKGLNLYDLNNSIFGITTLSVFFMIAYGLKSLCCLLVIKVLSEIKLSSPFTAEVSARLERISYFILGIWVMTML